jgi:hypothetical protein
MIPYYFKNGVAHLRVDADRLHSNTARRQRMFSWNDNVNVSFQDITKITDSTTRGGLDGS